MPTRAEPPVTWDSYLEALSMFLHGVTVPSASRIAGVVGTWLVLVNHGSAVVDGQIPWVKVVLDYATPFTVASLGFLAGRRKSNVELMIRLFDTKDP